MRETSYFVLILCPRCMFIVTVLTVLSGSQSSFALCCANNTVLVGIFGTQLRFYNFTSDTVLALLTVFEIEVGCCGC
jgi:hypothetical protein